VAWLVLNGRNVALERGERATAAFSAVVEQQAVLTFRSLSLTLAAVGDAHALAQPRPNDPQFQKMMARRLEDIPFVRAIFIIGPDGWLIHDTDYPKTPNISLADRPYFRAHAQDASMASAVWPPYFSRSGTGWFLPVTHALGRSRGFTGIVVAAIQADHFSEAFHQIGLADGYSVALVHRDGMLVAADPPRPADVGKRFELLPAGLDSKAAATRAVWSDSGDGILPGERVVSYRAVENAPFVVLVSRTRSDVLAEWRRTAAGAAVAMLALTVFLGWFVARLAREQATREHERQRRVQAEKLEALGQLTAGIAHDFGNMLNVVAVGADLLRHQRDDPSTVEQALAGLDRAVSGGKRVINRLLSFARRTPLTVTPVRLDAWLAEAGPLLTQAAGARVFVTVEPGPPVPEVLCDTGELDMALVNLIVNASDAMEGKGRILVRVFPCLQGNGPSPQPAGAGAAFVCLTVQDNGPGMSEEVRRRALEPFYTTKGEAGTGLGLSQVYGLMRQLGGNMTLDVAPGGGTAVRLFFPAFPPDAHPHPRADVQAP
jgi:signal transduction histidine kinase